jgi:hypothetical protein
MKRGNGHKTAYKLRLKVANHKEHHNVIKPVRNSDTADGHSKHRSMKSNPLVQEMPGGSCRRPEFNKMQSGMCESGFLYDKHITRTK